MILLICDTEFTDLTPEMELLSLALVSFDGTHEFYGERSDVPRERCSVFVRDAVLPQLTAPPPVSGDIANLRSRLRAFIDELPDRARIACDSHFDVALLSWALGDPWPPKLDGGRLDLSRYMAHLAFSEAQERYHIEHRYHHALNDARALRAGLLAFNQARS